MPHDIIDNRTRELAPELNALRHANVTGQALVAQLLRVVRDYDLEAAYRAVADRAEEAPLIPRIICSEVLV
jgi:hypothetical protein